LADAVVNGKALRIEGGNYELRGRGEDVFQTEETLNKENSLLEG
jgi:hypothetical protein